MLNDLMIQEPRGHDIGDPKSVQIRTLDDYTFGQGPCTTERGHVKLSTVELQNQDHDVHGTILGQKIGISYFPLSLIENRSCFSTV